MKLELTDQQIDALGRLLYETVQGQSNMTNAVYVSPAGQLRAQAARIEQREQDAPFIREILKALSVARAKP